MNPSKYGLVKLREFLPVVQCKEFGIIKQFFPTTEHTAFAVVETEKGKVSSAVTARVEKFVSWARTCQHNRKNTAVRTERSLTTYLRSCQRRHLTAYADLIRGASVFL